MGLFFLKKKNNFGVVLKLYNATCYMYGCIYAQACVLAHETRSQDLASGRFCLWYLTQGKTENLGIVINCLTQYCRAEEQQQKMRVTQTSSKSLRKSSGH